MLIKQVQYSTLANADIGNYGKKLYNIYELLSDLQNTCYWLCNVASFNFWKMASTMEELLCEWGLESLGETFSDKFSNRILHFLFVQSIRNTSEVKQVMHELSLLSIIEYYRRLVLTCTMYNVTHDSHDCVCGLCGWRMSNHACSPRLIVRNYFKLPVTWKLTWPYCN